MNINATYSFTNFSQLFSHLSAISLSIFPSLGYFLISWLFSHLSAIFSFHGYFLISWLFSHISAIFSSHGYFPISRLFSHLSAIFSSLDYQLGYFLFNRLFAWQFSKNFLWLVSGFKDSWAVHGLVLVLLIGRCFYHMTFQRVQTRRQTRFPRVSCISCFSSYVRLV